MLSALIRESKETRAPTRSVSLPEPARELHPRCAGIRQLNSRAALGTPSAGSRLQPTISNQGALHMLGRPMAASGVSNSLGSPVLQRKCDCGGSGSECACKEEQKQGLLQRKTSGPSAANVVPPIVDRVLRSPGRPLDRTTRAFFEPRFGYDFSGVRVHTDAQAAQSAKAVDALAYTFGSDVVFADGLHSPGTSAGKFLLAHELAHVVQSGGRSMGQAQSISAANDRAEGEAERSAQSVMNAEPVQSAGLLTPASPTATLHRTPASKVSCGAHPPLTLPDGTMIADPVAVITAAETQANQWLDASISSLEFARAQILGGAPIGWPTIPDNLAQALQLVGLDPNSDRVWRQAGGVGNYTVALLLRRLHAFRNSIGSGNFFFVCLGPNSGTIGTCVGDICAGGNVASSCAGSFITNFCPPFWADSADGQAATLLHEASHNFAFFIQHSGREGNAFCYERFALIASGTTEPHDHTDVCPDV